MGGIIVIVAFIAFVAYVFHKVYNFRLDKLDNGEWVVWYNSSDLDVYHEPIRKYWPKPDKDRF